LFHEKVGGQKQTKALVPPSPGKKVGICFPSSTGFTIIASGARKIKELNLITEG